MGWVESANVFVSFLLFVGLRSEGFAQSYKTSSLFNPPLEMRLG